MCPMDPHGFCGVALGMQGSKYLASMPPRWMDAKEKAPVKSAPWPDLRFVFDEGT